MIKQIIKLLVAILVMFLLSSCLSPLESNSGDASDLYIQPLSFLENFPLKFDNQIETIEIKDEKSILFQGVTTRVKPILFPKSMTPKSDTLLVKYWGALMEDGKLIEYGYQKVSQYNHDNVFAEKIYPEKVPIADFNSITYNRNYSDDILTIVQDAKRKVLSGKYESYALPVTITNIIPWQGLSDQQYTIYFENYRIFKVEGSIDGHYFEGVKP